MITNMIPWSYFLLITLITSTLFCCKGLTFHHFLHERFRFYSSFSMVTLTSTTKVFAMEFFLKGYSSAVTFLVDRVMNIWSVSDRPFCDIIDDSISMVPQNIQHIFLHLPPSRTYYPVLPQLIFLLT